MSKTDQEDLAALGWVVANLKISSTPSSSVKRPPMGFVSQHIVRGRFRKRDFALRAFIVATVEGAASRASTNTPIRLNRGRSRLSAFVAHRTTAPGRQAVHG
ncbi:MAG TPA: hypothetical protein VGI47_07465, partial [Candidatus Binataceae bacterium]